MTEAKLDMDAFYLMKELNIRPDVLPVYKRKAFWSWSLVGQRAYRDGKFKKEYHNGLAWVSPALFSDGIGVMVLEKDTTQQGISFHVREVNESSRMIELGQEGQFVQTDPRLLTIILEA